MATISGVCRSTASALGTKIACQGQPWGTIVFELDADKSPVTTANFLRYVDGKFYDGGRFHRTVTPDNQPDIKVKMEVIQAGMDALLNRMVEALREKAKAV